MYLHTEPARVPPPGAGDREEAARLLAARGQDRTVAAGWVLVPLGSPNGHLVTLRTEAQVPTVGAAGAGGYAVLHHEKGVAAAEPAHYASLLWFDGPRSDALAAASTRAGERIRPVMAGLPGLVEVVIARAADNSELAVNLVTAVEVLDEIARRVFSTTLGPDEDPALLPGPDRVDVCAVRAVSGSRAGPVPATQLAGSAS